MLLARFQGVDERYMRLRTDGTVWLPVKAESRINPIGPTRYGITLRDGKTLGVISLRGRTRVNERGGRFPRVTGVMMIILRQYPTETPNEGFVFEIDTEKKGTIVEKEFATVEALRAYLKSKGVANSAIDEALSEIGA